MYPLPVELPPDANAITWFQSEMPALVRNYEPERLRELQFAITEPLELPTVSVPGSASTRDALFDRLLKDVTSELDEYATFSAGWDGYSAVMFSRELLNTAKTLATDAISKLKLMNLNPGKVVPGPASDGSVDLEFVQGDRRAIITLSPDSRLVEFYREKNSDYMTEQEKPLNAATLEELCSWLAA